jgi:hypothetical protein
MPLIPTPGVREKKGLVKHKLEMRLTSKKRLKRLIFSQIVEKIFLRSKKSRVARLSAKFVFSTHENYPGAKFFHSRELLWKSFGDQLGKAQWIGFEFGVASGDATRKFMKMPYVRNCLAWHGFDTFFGLPHAWGDLPKGAFSTRGNPPSLPNPVIKWHIGLIQDTCHSINSLNYLDKKFVMVFDFDLYSATKTAWDSISKFLKPGDIIYFDEAYEVDEAKVIDEILESNIKFEILGYTTMGIAFKII